MSFKNECLDYMDSCGLGVFDQNKIRFTGDVERYTVRGDKKGSKNGWMVYRDDLKPSCTFGSWKTGETVTWFAEDIKDLPTAEQKRIKRELVIARMNAKKARDEEVRRQRIEASQQALKIWNSSSELINDRANHSYSLTKKIKPFFSRFERETGCLILPMLNHENRLSSIQRIYPNGKKMFLSGGGIEHCSMTLNKMETRDNKYVFICEGYATGCTIHEITKAKVVICFNANNLETVTAITKSKHPDMKIFICADNDHQTIINGVPTNVGEIKANEAASKNSVYVIYYGTDKHGTDWNDYHVMRGFDEACAWFDFRLSAALKGEPEYVE